MRSGITQITAWGTSYYCLGVLAKPIVADTGWPLTTVFLGFSVALLVMGLISTSVGRLIDRIGARPVMCVGTIIVSAGLLALSQVWDQVSYLAVWVVIGIGMRCCLYDAAFAALVQVMPTRGRKAISYLTLYGAYASTVFWVVGHYLNESLWLARNAHRLRCDQSCHLPAAQLARFGAPRARRRCRCARRNIGTSPDGPALEGRMRVIGIVLFALIMSLNGFVFGVISIQLVPLLEAAGLVGATAVWVASLKGHGQFAGRVVEIFFGRNLKSHDDRSHCHSGRSCFLGAPVSCQRRFSSAHRLHTAAGCLPRRHHHCQGRGSAGAFRSERLRRVLGLIATPILLVNAFSQSLRFWLTNLAGKSPSTRSLRAR